VKEWIYRRFNYPCARYPDLFFFFGAADLHRAGQKLLGLGLICDG